MPSYQAPFQNQNHMKTVFKNFFRMFWKKIHHQKSQKISVYWFETDEHHKTSILYNEAHFPFISLTLIAWLIDSFTYVNNYLITMIIYWLLGALGEK